MTKTLLLCLLLTACNQPTPVPSPVPTPSPIVTQTPTPSPAPTATVTPSPVAQNVFVTSSADVNGTYYPNVSLSLAKNEIAGLWLAVSTDTCLTAKVTGGASAVFFSAKLVTFATPSYIGAQASGFDPLVPVTQLCSSGVYFADVTGPGTISVGSASIAITQNQLTFGPKPSTPLYIGLNASFTHTLGLDGNVTTEGPIVSSTVQMMRAHRIEPYNQNISTFVSVTNGKLDYDKWAESMGSFRQLVLNGAVAPPCVVAPGTTAVSTAYLAAVQAGIASGDIPAGAWAYGWDEDQLAAPGPALTRINAIHAGAPGLDIIATREEDVNLSAVTQFVPILDWFKQPGHVQTYTKPYGVYTSCMAQGCGGGPGKPSGAPLLVADAPAVQALAFPLVAVAMKAKFSLYYSAVEHFGATTNYFSNGNGDGQLLYAGPKTVYPSVRLKLLREGMFMAEYMKLNPTPFASLIASGTSFSHLYSDFQAARNSVAQAYR